MYQAFSLLTLSTTTEDMLVTKLTPLFRDKAASVRAEVVSALSSFQPTNNDILEEMARLASTEKALYV